jgi:hypothetical protein
MLSLNISLLITRIGVRFLGFLCFQRIFLCSYHVKEYVFQAIGEYFYAHSTYRCAFYAHTARVGVRFPGFCFTGHGAR